MISTWGISLNRLMISRAYDPPLRGRHHPKAEHLHGWRIPDVLDSLLNVLPSHSSIVLAANVAWCNAGNT